MILINCASITLLLPLFNRRRNGNPFICCIIDEASQCTEPESLTPLVYGINKLVIVGDPEQLPATVCSPVSKIG